MPAGVTELPGAHDLGADPRGELLREGVVDAAAAAVARRRLCHQRVANIHWCSLLSGVAEMKLGALPLAGAEAVEGDGEVLDAGE